jgi:hypothetical protein
MVRARVYGILAGYEDQNDHDTLRADPVFKLVAGRSPEDDDLVHGGRNLRPVAVHGPRVTSVQGTDRAPDSP